nr:MAG TPA: Protein of unknown function (DUF2577) [Caudoviricetes sp.]
MWEYDLAGMLRERDNPTTKIGACLGEVISTSPMTISIQNGQYIIKGDMLYVAYHLLQRASTYSQMSQSGTISVSCPHGGGSYTSSSTGSITLDAVIKAGDLVMVVPDESEQHFFIVDVVRKIAGCNNSAV